LSEFVVVKRVLECVVVKRVLDIVRMCGVKFAMRQAEILKSDLYRLSSEYIIHV